MKKIGIMSLTVMLLLLVAGCKNTEVVPTGLEEEQNTETDSALDTEAETEPEAELMEVPIDNLSVGVDKVTTLEFPAYESGEPVIEMTQDGIVEVLDSYWYDLTLFVKMKGISAGETEMTIEVGAYRYRTMVTVEQEDTVYLTEGNLCLDMQVDKTDATVYLDDTAVTYTVITTPSVDSLVFEQLAPYATIESYTDLLTGTAAIFSLNTLTVDNDMLTDTWKEGENQTRYQAKKEVQEDAVVWTVQ